MTCLGWRCWCSYDLPPMGAAYHAAAAESVRDSFRSTTLNREITKASGSANPAEREPSTHSVVVSLRAGDGSCHWRLPGMEQRTLGACISQRYFHDRVVCLSAV